MWYYKNNMPEDEMLAGLPESQYGFIYHYYRAEVYRETNWRNRLDVTTNWAIVVTAAILSLIFSEPTVPHTVILINYLIVWFFLYIESRRFRYYSILRKRTRALEKHLLAPIFNGSNVSPKMNATWRDKLAKSLAKPEIPISKLEALSWRLRRNYLLIFPVLFVTWLAKIQNSPVHAESLEQLFTNAKLWIIPGEIVFIAFFASIAATMGLAVYISRKSEHDDLP